MTRERATPLTDEQISIIRGNQETMLPADISHLPGMEGTTVRQIRECQLRKPSLFRCRILNRRRWNINLRMPRSREPIGNL